jgi:predicted DNA binding protein
MGDYILAEVEMFEPQSCHIAPFATEEWTVTDVSRNGLGGEDGEVVEEFTLTGEADGEPPVSADSEAIERVFAFDDEYIFRTARPADRDCACERIERAGCVVQDITITDATLEITFLVDDTETLRTVIDDLRGTAETVTLRRLVESCERPQSREPTVLDRDALTDRQREVLETAYEMGYFRKPRAARAGDVAQELDISTTTFTEHLAAAQRKLLGDVLKA